MSLINKPKSWKTPVTLGEEMIRIPVKKVTPLRQGGTWYRVYPPEHNRRG
jgi:hypothetical protein